MNKIIKAALPYGLIKLWLKRQQKIKERLPKEVKEIIQLNEKFRDIHKGERCFIVGTGPSINKQNLLPLKDEIVFSLSRFYHHEKYEQIRPKYQIFSGLVLHPHIFENKDLPYDFYHEAEKKVVSDEIFTHYGDKDFIDENDLFKEQNINYFVPYAYLKDIHNRGVDLSQPIFGYYVISELAIQIAIYMGFKEIYLLGLDHTWLKEVINNRDYEHQFYNNDNTNNDHGECIKNIQSNFDLDYLVGWYHNFFTNYQQLNDYCLQRDVKILNATAGGMLNTFERVNYEDILHPS